LQAGCALVFSELRNRFRRREVGLLFVCVEHSFPNLDESVREDLTTCPFRVIDRGALRALICLVTFELEGAIVVWRLFCAEGSFQLKQSFKVWIFYVAS